MAAAAVTASHISASCPVIVLFTEPKKSILPLLTVTIRVDELQSVVTEIAVVNYVDKAA